MFVDDLEVYAEDKEGLKEVVRLVEWVSGKMGMELGLRKCAMTNMRQGSSVMSGRITLKSGEEMSELEEGGVYQYQEVAQRFGPDLTKTKQGVGRETRCRT